MFFGTGCSEASSFSVEISRSLAQIPREGREEEEEEEEEEEGGGVLGEEGGARVE